MITAIVATIIPFRIGRGKRNDSPRKCETFAKLPWLPITFAMLVIIFVNVWLHVLMDHDNSREPENSGLCLNSSSTEDGIPYTGLIGSLIETCDCVPQELSTVYFEVPVPRLYPNPRSISVTLFHAAFLLLARNDRNYGNGSRLPGSSGTSFCEVHVSSPNS